MNGRTTEDELYSSQSQGNKKSQTYHSTCMFAVIPSYLIILWSSKALLHATCDSKPNRSKESELEGRRFTRIQVHLDASRVTLVACEAQVKWSQWQLKAYHGASVEVQCSGSNAQSYCRQFFLLILRFQVHETSHVA